MTATLDTSTSFASRSELGPIAARSAEAVILLGPVVGFGAIEAPFVVEFAISMLAFGAFVIAPPVVLRRFAVPLPFLVFIVWMVGSIGWSTDTDATVEMVKERLPIIAGLVVAAALLPQGRTLARLADSFRLGIAVTAVVLVVSPVTRSRQATFRSSALDGWHGNFVHKNSLAIYLVLGLAVFLTVDKRGPVRAASLALVGVMLVGAHSATGIAGAVGVVALWSFLQLLSRTERRWRAGVVATSVIGFTLAGAGLVLLLPNILAFYGKDLTLSGRTAVWGAVSDAIAHRPFAGYGVGAVFSEPPSQVRVEITRASGFDVPHPHQGTLDVLLALGAVGLVLFVVSLLITLVMALRLLAKDPPLAQMVVLTLFAVVVLSLSESVFLGRPLMMLGIAQTLVFASVISRSNMSKP